MSKLSILTEFWEFLKVRKNFGLHQLFSFCSFGTLIVLTEGTAIAPFIYALF